MPCCPPANSVMTGSSCRPARKDRWVVPTPSAPHADPVAEADDQRDLPVAAPRVGPTASGCAPGSRSTGAPPSAARRCGAARTTSLCTSTFWHRPPTASPLLSRPVPRAGPRAAARRRPAAARLGAHRRPVRARTDGGRNAAAARAAAGAAGWRFGSGGVPTGRKDGKVCAGSARVASSRNVRQIEPGSPLPLIGVPLAVRIGLFWSVPIHTTAAIDGVYPAIHASLFSPSKRDCTVPVFAATCWLPGSRSPSWRATSSIASVTLRATCAGIRRSSPCVLGLEEHPAVGSDHLGHQMRLAVHPAGGERGVGGGQLERRDLLVPERDPRVRVVHRLTGSRPGGPRRPPPAARAAAQGCRTRRCWRPSSPA